MKTIYILIGAFLALGALTLLFFSVIKGGGGNGPGPGPDDCPHGLTRYPNYNNACLACDPDSTACKNCSKDSDCKHGGTCIAGADGHGACSCPDPYFGETCQKVCSTDADCGDHGTCGSDNTCQCEAGYTGNQCDTKVTKCDPSDPEGSCGAPQSKCDEQGNCKCPSDPTNGYWRLDAESGKCVCQNDYNPPDCRRGDDVKYGDSVYLAMPDFHGTKTTYYLYTCGSDPNRPNRHCGKTVHGENWLFVDVTADVSKKQPFTIERTTGNDPYIKSGDTVQLKRGGAYVGMCPGMQTASPNSGAILYMQPSGTESLTHDWVLTAQGKNAGDRLTNNDVITLVSADKSFSADHHMTSMNWGNPFAHSCHYHSKDPLFLTYGLVKSGAQTERFQVILQKQT